VNNEEIRRRGRLFLLLAGVVFVLGAVAQVVFVALELEHTVLNAAAAGAYGFLAGVCLTRWRGLR
jgi:hypothetical protein